jgi:2-polyprenyl-3-methyl-5-hydroxy-6-metoxy-1,4-benzoquinol methylase
MLKYIPPRVRTTLDFGCGCGGFSSLVKERFGTEAWAVEIEPAAALAASQKLDKVIHGDALAALAQIPDNYFDCVILCDVIEHLVDPYSLLLAVKAKLTSNGVVVASIPNIRYYRAFVKFAVHGDWQYTDQGILDRTHLRFFTRKSIIDTFEQLGYVILVLEGIHATSSRTYRLLNAVLFNKLADMRHLQFAVVAKPRT